MTTPPHTQHTHHPTQAGGKNVIFDETLTFLNKQLMESTLKVRVCDKDTLSDDILGEYDVNLNLQNLVKEDAESEVTRKARMVAPDTL